MFIGNRDLNALCTRRPSGVRGVVVAGAAALAMAFSATSALATKLTPSAAQPQQDSTYSVKPVKSRLGQIAVSDPSLLNRSDTTPVNVVVKLDYDAVASYEGNVPGYAATSPKKTGKKLKQNKAAVDAYTRYAAGYEAQVLARVKSKVPSAKVGASLKTVYGGVAMTLPANKIGELLAIDGVVAVQKDSLEQPLTDATPGFLGATTVWPTIGGSTKAGEGVLVGILDTGVWPEHPSFIDQGLAPPPGGPFTCQFGGSGAAGDAAFACNNKLVGAYTFLNTYRSVYGSSAVEFCTGAGNACSARDAEGHGTHTATTAAGGPADNATLLGVNRGHVSGIAPGAHVIAYRVCRVEGCFGSDSVAAVGQAIADGVDVINFSISGGVNAYTDPVELAFFDAYAAGTLVNASSGNAGPGAGTANHASPWVNTVGASTSNRHFFSTLHLTADFGATLDLQGVTVTAGVGLATEVVSNVGDPLCEIPAAPGTFAGKVVVCLRGTNARVDKGYNVLQGGAAGMILANPAIQQLNSDSHWLPAIHIEGPNSLPGNTGKLLDFLATHTGVKATWSNGTASPVAGDVMASFSSRGPLGDFIKPDVTAPGLQILAGMTPMPDPANTAAGPSGELYQAIAGTSMSSPHAAGVAALIKAAHPNWTPGQIKSALMTSSVQATFKEDGVTPADPFDRGAGAIRANRAVNPTVTFDVSPLEYIASADDVLGRVGINLPSVNAPVMPGEITTWRTMKNVTSSAQDLEVSVQAPPGVEIIVTKSKKGGKTADQSDKQINVAQGTDETIQITIKAPTVPDGQYFGQITLDPKKKGHNEVVIPVAFFKKQGQVALAQSCAPSTFARNTGKTTCTVRAENLVGTDASVNIVVNAGKDLDYSNVSGPATLAKKDKIVWTGTLAATTPPEIFVVSDPLGSPAGYLPLSIFGVTPVAGVGDETIANFNVPPFLYGGETYTRIGVVSNGYVVVGGGTGADVTFINQDLPNASRPNNVIAPWWTDLNPAFGGTVRVGTLSGGGQTWIVIEFEDVREYSSANTASFQVWIGVAANSLPEDITMTYGTLTGSGDGGFLTVGAENRVGNRGQNYYVDGTGTLPNSATELRVTSIPPAAGGVVNFTYDATSKKAGTTTTTANLTSDLTPGVTQDVEVLSVTP